MLGFLLDYQAKMVSVSTNITKSLFFYYKLAHIIIVLLLESILEWPLYTISSTCVRHMVRARVGDHFVKLSVSTHTIDVERKVCYSLLHYPPENTPPPPFSAVDMVA